MLKSINIKNYALAEDIDVSFEGGLNIITGETGAGKSIIIDALGLLLGNRASKEIVRTGAARAVIEGIWDVENTEKLQPIFEQHALEFNDELIIRREVTDRGTSRALINDALVPLSVLSEVSQWLVDLHGQHHHQLLLNPENHLQFYDDVVLELSEVAEINDSFLQVLEKRQNFAEIRKKIALLKQQKNLFEYEFKELDKAGLKRGEWEEINKNLNTLENAETIIKLCQNLTETVEEGEISATQIIASIKHDLEQLTKYDNMFTEYLEELENSSILLSEIGSSVVSYGDSLNFDAVEIDTLRARYIELKSIQKKFNRDNEALLAYYEQLRDDLGRSEFIDEEVNKAEQEYENSRIEFGKKAMSLSIKRENQKHQIEKQFEKELNNLGMQEAKFQIRIWREEQNGGEAFSERRYFTGNSRGIDRLEYYIAPNVGEDFKPMAKIASGGEISRIMLALKKILAGSERIPSLVFDEIDNGISGNVAIAVGKTMRELASRHQIICITHLPQIAAFAEHHYKVSKKARGNRTFTSIQKLNDNDKIKEVASLIGGENKMDEILTTAQNLINESQN